MLPRSLFARLLALSLTVAVAAVAATAWLTTRTTSQRILGEFDRQLEADAFVYTRLLEHAATSADWADADGLLAELALRTGRRVALTTPGGVVIADTAADQAGAPVALPDVAAAVIDPFSPLDVGAGADQSSAALERRGVVTTSGPRLEPPVVQAERTSRLERTVACLHRHGHEVSVSDLTADSGPDIGDVPPEVAEPCGAYDAANAPTEIELALQRQVEAATGACLTEVGVPRADKDRLLSGLVDAPSAGSDDTRGPILDPLEAGGASPPTSPSPDRTPHIDSLERCRRSARRSTYGPLLADPALLYLGEGPTRGLLTAVGGGRLLGTLGLVLLAVLGVTVFAGRRLVAPVRSLTDAARRMASGERSARVEISGRDDVAQLGNAFNAMAASVEQAEQDRRAVISDVAHELRTPLTRLRGHLEAAEDGVLEADDAYLASLLEDSAVMQRLVEDLQQLALADAGGLTIHPYPIDVARLASRVVDAFTRRARDADVTLTLHASGPIDVDADPERLRQAVDNLVSNALAYTPAGGQVDVTVREAAEAAVIEVADSGVGIDAEHLPHVFDRFYRADPSRSRHTGGSGLGLAVARSLVEAHGGTIEVTSALGQGSTFTINLPRPNAPRDPSIGDQ